MRCMRSRLWPKNWLLTATKPGSVDGHAGVAHRPDSEVRCNRMAVDDGAGQELLNLGQVPLLDIFELTISNEEVAA